MYPLLCSCRQLAFQNLELHRTFFLSFWKIELEMSLHLSDWMKACQSKRWAHEARVHGRDVIGLPCQNPSNQKNPNVPNRQTTLVICSWNDFPCLHTRLHLHNMQQLPVKFVFLLRASYLFSRRGEKKTGAQQIFSPARAVDEFENSAMCTIPNSDVPALLGRQPNTSLAFE